MLCLPSLQVRSNLYSYETKKWVVDVDTHDETILQAVRCAINNCRSGNLVSKENNLYDNVIAEIPTLNGVHFITCGFDKSQLNKKIFNNLSDVDYTSELHDLINEVCKSIKKDNPTLLYFEKQ